MIIVQVGEPKQKTIGDYWFDPTTKVTSRASVLTSSLSAPGMPSGTANQVVWIQVQTRYSMGQALSNLSRLKIGQVFVEVTTDVPYMWDGTGWIPAVPTGYNFPPPKPQIGDTWTEPTSQVLYIWSGQAWHQMIGGPGAPIPGFTVTGSLGIPGPVGNPGPVGPVGNTNYAPGYVYQGSQGWVPVPGVVGAQSAQATSAPLQITPNSNNWTNMSLTIGNNCIDIDTATGKVTLGPNYTPDTASDMFWKHVQANHPTTVIESLREALKEASDELQAFKDAGFKLPKKQDPFDPNTAWDAAMGIIK